MASKKSALFWPFAPKEVGLNRDTNLLKIVAMITMVVDHVGKMFFPRYQVLRIIGRIAFPIYAYCIAVGCVYSKNKLKYLTRILLMGLISQPIYAMAMGHTTSSMYAIAFRDNPVLAVLNFFVESFNHPNIMFTLAVGLMIIWTLREKHLVLTVALAVFTWKFQGSLDYGWRGVALIALFYIFIERWWLSLPVMAAYMFWWGTQYSRFQMFGIRFGIQMFAILALILIYIPTFTNLKINKWFYYLFYPAHLICILLVEYAQKVM